MANLKLLAIKIAYANLEKQQIISLSVTPGTTIKAAISLSGILNQFPEIDLSRQKVGIFSQIKTLEDVVNEGDRIEIYRPLLIDPKEARRAKAKTKKK